MSQSRWIPRLFTRAMLRGSAFSGAYGKLRLLYALEDPWEMGSAREQYRFEATNAQLAGIAPRFDRLLELGCGEGHQSVHLAQLADQLFALDVSGQAVARARRRCPVGRFETGRIEDIGTLFPGIRFDLVTACEVLYYATDIPGMLTELQARTEHLYVSNYKLRAEAMRTHFVGPGWTALPSIRHLDTVWECRLWKRPQTG